MTVLEKISQIGIVPVIAIDDPDLATDLAKALIDGGLACAEVTFRTAAAEASIKNMVNKYPEMLVGAGTVLTTEQAQRAIDSGAKFIVSPGLNPKVVAYCLEKEITIIPGCATPSDVEAALELGLEVVKFFPAESAGGIKMIKAMSAPYTKVKFMPTGGITPDNVLDYLKFNKVIACGGSWMVPKDLINSKAFDKIQSLSKDAVGKMLGFSIVNIGINADSFDSANATADKFDSVFGFAKKTTDTSVFSGSELEIIYASHFGASGHITIGTNFIQRAIYHLQQRGLEFDESTRKFDEKGNTTAIRIKGEFSGFAVNLLQNKPL